MPCITLKVTSFRNMILSDLYHGFNTIKNVR